MIAAGKMRLVVPAKPQTIRLWFVNDLHLGNKGCAKDRLKKDIQSIADDPYSIWIGGGDYADYISPSDPRFDPSVLSDDLSTLELGSLGYALAERVRDMLMPIRHKCLGLLMGNHEWQYMSRHEQQTLHNWLCTELKVNNLGYSCFLDLVISRSLKARQPVLRRVYRGEKRVEGYSGSKAFRIFAHHGAGAAQTHGGRINRLARFMQDFDADIYFMGHVHDDKGLRISVLRANAACTEITEAQRIGVISGSYLRGYTQGVTSYSERFGHRPTPLGMRCAVIRMTSQYVGKTHRWTFELGAEV